MTFQDYIATRKGDLRGAGKTKLREMVDVEAMSLLHRDLIQAAIVARAVARQAGGDANVSLEDVLRVNAVLQTYTLEAYHSLIQKGEVDGPGQENEVEIPITVEEPAAPKGKN